MTKFPKLALAAVLMTGAGSIALTVPALAKDKKEEAAKPGLKLSPDVVKPANAAQTAIIAKDIPTAQAALAQLDAAAKTDDDKYIAASLRYNFEIQKMNMAQAANPNQPADETVLAAPLDALLASPSTPAADRGKYAYRRGALSFNGKQYPQALQYFNQAKQAGYTDPNLDLQIAQSKMNSGDVAGSIAQFDAYVASETAAGRPVKEDVYRYVIARTNQAKMNAVTMVWLKKYAIAYPTSKVWHDVIGTYLAAQGNALDKSQKLDVYRLMRASKSIADQYDYDDYAQKTYDMGLPYETKAVITEGKAAGKIPANSPSANSLLTGANASIKTEGSLAPLQAKAKAAANGKTAAQTGDAYLGTGDYTTSIGLYRLALQKGGVNADEVNTHLGIALTLSGDKAGAKAAFAAVTGTPRTDIAGLWTTFLDAPVTA